jgi:hypothetical protein
MLWTAVVLNEVVLWRNAVGPHQPVVVTAVITSCSIWIH